MTTEDEARAVVQAKIDNALDAMPPRSRERTEIDVQVPISALRTLLASRVSTPPSEDWEYGVKRADFEQIVGYEVEPRTPPRVGETPTHWRTKAGPWLPVPAVPVPPTEPEYGEYELEELDESGYFDAPTEPEEKR